MGGWDINCAFCGASFRNDNAFNEDDSERDAYNPSLISEQDLEWLEQVQVIGFNPDSFTVDKCYITGIGEEEGYGQVTCDRGDDPNVPTDRRLPDRIQIATYSTYDPDQPFGVPFHPPCFRVFAQALRYQFSGQIIGLADKGIVDKSILYTVMSGLHEEYDHCLRVDYAELNDAANEQYWGCRLGQEAWVSNPFQNEKVSQFWKALKYEQTTTNTQPISTPAKSVRSLPRHPKSPLTKLADEIVLEILLYLEYKDIRSFIHSGLTPINLSQAQGYWKRRIPIDMPFLWDLPDLDGLRDFFKIYHELRRQCFATTPPLTEDDEGNTIVDGPLDKTLVLGLANRRRVWNTCSRIAELHVEEQKALEQRANKKQSQITSEEIFKNSMSLHFPLVASPVSKEFRSIPAYFITSWDDLEAEHILTFHFSDDGRLCGVEVDTPESSSGSSLLGEKAPRFGSCVAVELTAGTWITGFELNIGNCNDLDTDAIIGITGLKLYLQNGEEKQVSASDGGKRRMVAGNGMVITGVVSEFANGVIQRLGLLQCLQTLNDKLPLRSHSIPIPKSNQTIQQLVLTQPLAVPQIDKCMWRDSAPSSGLAASTYQTGYWTPVRSYDTIPMEALVFGTTDDELSQITGFSSDPEKRSLAIQLEDGSSKHIGPEAPSPNSKVFKIDGKGGERVTKVEIGMNSLPMAIKIATNRGRHCFFGTTQKNQHIIYEPGDSAFVAGIYASWGYKTGEKPDCTTISIISGSESGEGAVEVIGVRHDDAWPPQPDSTGIMYNFENIAVVDEDDYEEFHGKYW